MAIFLFFILDMTTDFWFGSMLPGYDWKSQSISYIGNSASPVLHLVKIWGVLFTILVVLFANSFAIQFRKNSPWGLIGALFLILYGLGEGLGSAFFPIHPEGAPVTTSTLFHDTFSSLGDMGLILLPFVMMFIYPRHSNKAYHFYLWSVVFMGLFWAALFLTAKYFTPHNFILAYKGVWQRLYTLNYYVQLLVLGIKMWPASKSAP
ncbi:MAG: DUF998 domain-containing protein [Cyclobacteriaceae bacterium]|nr:DUF998 domain-containing protein [Cyclobacteriaceae bacterium]